MNFRAALEGDLGGGEVRFLLSAPEVDKRRSFYKGLAKLAELKVFDKLDSNRSGWEEAALDLVQSLGRERQLRFEEEALDLFVLLTGGDTRTIKNELEKIDLFLGEKERRVTPRRCPHSRPAFARRGRLRARQRPRRAPPPACSRAR